MFKRKVVYGNATQTKTTPVKIEPNILTEKDMTDENIKKWLESDVSKNGFVNATTLAENFFKAHHITDALDPVFSLALDLSFNIASEIRDKKMSGI